MTDSPPPFTDEMTAFLNGPSTEKHGDIAQFLYNELRRIAQRYMRPERADHTLQPTDLVNEAYLRLLPSQNNPEVTTRRFLGYAARAMRQVLTDHARKRNAEKRGGGWSKITLQGLPATHRHQAVDIVILDEAMEWLETQDPALAEMTEWHYFGGMTGHQIAALRSVSRTTVTRELSLARALLLREIDRILADSV